MNGSNLEEAIRWLLKSVERTDFGRVSLEVVVHGAHVRRIEKSLTESFLAADHTAEPDR